MAIMRNSVCNAMESRQRERVHFFLRGADFMSRSLRRKPPLLLLLRRERRHARHVFTSQQDPNGTSSSRRRALSTLLFQNNFCNSYRCDRFFANILKGDGEGIFGDLTCIFLTLITGYVQNPKVMSDLCLWQICNLRPHYSRAVLT